MRLSYFSSDDFYNGFRSAKKIQSNKYNYFNLYVDFSVVSCGVKSILKKLVKKEMYVYFNSFIQIFMCSETK